MFRDRTATAWIFALGVVLLFIGVWLATLTMKRRAPGIRASKFAMPAARKMWSGAGRGLRHLGI